MKVNTLDSCDMVDEMLFGKHQNQNTMCGHVILCSLAKTVNAVIIVLLERVLTVGGGGGGGGVNSGRH